MKNLLKIILDWIRSLFFGSRDERTAKRSGKNDPTAEGRNMPVPARKHAAHSAAKKHCDLPVGNPAETGESEDGESGNSETAQNEDANNADEQESQVLERVLEPGTESGKEDPGEAMEERKPVTSPAQTQTDDWLLQQNSAAEEEEELLRKRRLARKRQEREQREREQREREEDLDQRLQALEKEINMLMINWRIRKRSVSELQKDTDAIEQNLAKLRQEMEQTQLSSTRLTSLQTEAAKLSSRLEEIRQSWLVESEEAKCAEVQREQQQVGHKRRQARGDDWLEL